MHNGSDDFAARGAGSLLGLAIGDALGAPVEFQPAGSLPPVTGYRGGGPHGLAAGERTDDTSVASAWPIRSPASDGTSTTPPCLRRSISEAMPAPPVQSPASRPGHTGGKSGITAELIGGLAQHETIEAAAKRLIAATRD